MADIDIRKDRHAGRITLTRPQALNALSMEMVLAATEALRLWQDDEAVRIVIIDAAGDRAFCAGGDVAALWHAAQADDHVMARDFFAAEYRLNAAIANFPRPVISFMQGFVMGGGVGVGANARIRIVGDTTRMAMPEASIGLVPDVTGSWHLARAPGRIGEYLGLTGTQMGPGDAIHAGFADRWLPEADWPAVIDHLITSGDPRVIPQRPAPTAVLEDRDLSAFGGARVDDIIAALEAAGDAKTLALLHRNAPLSLAATLAMIRLARSDRRIEESLSREYRFTSRATTEGDFLEGVRARLIDKDGKPAWRQPATRAKVDEMLSPLGADELSLGTQVA